MRQIGERFKEDLTRKKRQDRCYLFQKLTDKEIIRVDIKLGKVFQKQDPFLQTDDFKVFTRGKKLRPMLVILTSQLHLQDQKNGYLSGKIISMAAAVEMVHMASLIHDDIIDKAVTRRGGPTINYTKGNDLALLVGDLQFVEAMKLFTDSVGDMNEFGFLKRFLKTGYKVCRGEIEEYTMKYSPDFKLLRQKYFQNSKNKTAELISFSCELGAFLAKGSKEQIARMKRYGLYIGLAFQIMDDILDFIGDEKTLKKPILRDLSEKRMSLPIIYAMESLPGNNIVKKIIESREHNEEDITRGAEMIINSNALHRAYKDALSMTKKAVSQLADYPESKYKSALEELASFIIERRV